MKSELNNLSKQALIELVLKQHIQAQNHREELQHHKSELQHKNFIIDQLSRMLFGTKSEKFKTVPVDPSQLTLSFEELTAIKQPVEEDQDPTEKPATKKPSNKKNHPGRHKLPDDLPEKVIVIEPEMSTEGLVKIGEERTEILEIAPAKFFKLVIIRPKYAKKDGEGVFVGEMPSRPIEKCLAGNALLAHLLIGKYEDHLPLYRQQQIFKRLGIKIPPSTIDGWIRQLGTLLEPLYEAMVRAVKNVGYLQADETPLRVLDKRVKGKCHLGYFWAYHTPLKKLVVFDYKPGRNKDAPREILDDFKGYLQTDGYAVYDQYNQKQGVTHLACWAHARRYFEQALKYDKVRAEFAMQKIQQLYQIEREAKIFSQEDRKSYRIEKALPVINELGKFISEQNKEVLPKSPIGKAFGYAINRWDALQDYLYEGKLLIDNNCIENTIRPNALGRKNWLFAGSHNGAKRSAMFYSFLGTCKLNGVDPNQWLTHVLKNIAEHKVNRLHELFPQNFIQKINM